MWLVGCWSAGAGHCNAILLGEMEGVGRLPEAQEDGRADKGEDAAANVGHGVEDHAGQVVVDGGEGELEQGEGTTGDEQGGPDLERLPPGAHAADHVEGYEQR